MKQINQERQQRKHQDINKPLHNVITRTRNHWAGANRPGTKKQKAIESHSPEQQRNQAGKTPRILENMEQRNQQTKSPRQQEANMFSNTQTIPKSKDPTNQAISTSTNQEHTKAQKQRHHEAKTPRRRWPTTQSADKTKKAISHDTE